MQDDLQAFRLQQLDKCVKDLQIPCRWVPDMGFGYGYPKFIYYSPSVFYLGEVFHLLGLQFIDSIKLLFILGFVSAAITMYILLKSFTSQLGAFVGTMLYVYAPFRATQTFVRGALNEFWALSFFPLIFWSIFKFIKTQDKKYLLVYSISFGLLLITHNLMSAIFLPIAALWIAIWIVLEKQFRQILWIIFATLLGLGISAFFTIPLIFERPFAHLESLTGGYFGFEQHFVTFNQLFLSNHFAYGSSFIGSNDDLSLSVGIIHWPLVLLAVILSLVYFTRNKKISLITLFLSLISLFAAFLMHQKSTPIWNFVTPLIWLQFPWRFLAITSFSLSFLASIAIFLIPHPKIKLSVGICVIILILILYAPFFKAKEWYPISDKDKFSNQEWERQLTVSIFDYLPIFAEYPPNKKAPEQPEILEGQAQFSYYKKGSNFQLGEVNVTKKATIRLPLYDFPGMIVLVDGKRVEHTHNNCQNEDYCFGLITTTIPEGVHTLEVRLTKTWDQQLGDVISVLSIILILIGIKRYVNKKTH